MAVRAAKPRTPRVPEIRKGDTVVVLSGRDAGKRGKVERVVRRSESPTSGRSVYRRGSHAGGVSVVIEGINIAKRHTKPRQGSTGGIGGVPKVEPGGILDVFQPLPARSCSSARTADARRGSVTRPLTPVDGFACAATAGSSWR